MREEEIAKIQYKAYFRLEEHVVNSILRHLDRYINNFKVNNEESFVSNQQECFYLGFDYQVGFWYKNEYYQIMIPTREQGKVNSIYNDFKPFIEIVDESDLSCLTNLQKVILAHLGIRTVPCDLNQDAKNELLFYFLILSVLVPMDYAKEGFASFVLSKPDFISLLHGTAFVEPIHMITFKHKGMDYEFEYTNKNAFSEFIQSLDPDEIDFLSDPTKELLEEFEMLAMPHKSTMCMMRNEEEQIQYKCYVNLAKHVIDSFLIRLCELNENFHLSKEDVALMGVSYQRDIYYKGKYLQNISIQEIQKGDLNSIYEDFKSFIERVDESELLCFSDLQKVILADLGIKRLPCVLSQDARVELSFYFLILSVLVPLAYDITSTEPFSKLKHNASLVLLGSKLELLRSCQPSLESSKAFVEPIDMITFEYQGTRYEFKYTDKTAFSEFIQTLSDEEMNLLSEHTKELLEEFEILATPHKSTMCM